MRPDSSISLLILLRMKDWHCPSLLLGLEFPLIEPAEWLWSLLAAADGLRLPALVAELSFSEKTDYPRQLADCLLDESYHLHPAQRAESDHLHPIQHVESG